MMAFSEKLQRKVEEHNRKARANFELYASECKKQGVVVGQPIEIMRMWEVKKNETEKT